MSADPATETSGSSDDGTVLQKRVDRREAVGLLLGGLAAGAAAVSACSPLNAATPEERELKILQWEQFTQKHYRRMTEEERAETVQRLERLAKLLHDQDVTIHTNDAIPGVLFGYAFNITRCKGYRRCVEACINENNLDRKADTQYIRIFEKGNDALNITDADPTYQHEVPAAGYSYLGTQCFQCANPPCVAVCPVGATWQEPDGIVVIDYNWCVGCRACMAACPYWARRFNWDVPEVPNEEVNPNQHYLGNRARKQGCVEKCTFCVHRTRVGRLPACAEACPRGPGLRQPAGSRFRDPLGAGQQAGLPAEGRAGDRASLLVLH